MGNFPAFFSAILIMILKPGTEVCFIDFHSACEGDMMPAYMFKLAFVL